LSTKLHREIGEIAEIRKIGEKEGVGADSVGRLLDGLPGA
jgi:hypothetical protein